MIYGIPGIGWLIGGFIHMSLAIPFYFGWNYVAPKFFYFLPPQYLNVGFWEVFWLIVVVVILKTILIPTGLISSTRVGSK